MPAFPSWVEKHVTLPGGPFRFEGHEFLRAIYADDHHHRVFRKASQIGMSTHVLSRAAYKCKNVFRNGVIYYMPTEVHVQKFSKGIADPFFELNPGLLASGKGAKDSVTVKRLGFANLYFHGLKTSLAAKTVPADMIVLDEVDEITAHARKSAMQRVSHSIHGYVDELSIPSIPEYGVDASFETTDQRFWLIRCAGCREDHCLEEEFPACLQRQKDGRVLRACTKCGKELDVNAGRWVAKHPNVKDGRGYQLSQLFAPWINPTVILNEFEAGEDLDVFHNERLGVPYIQAENELKRDQVLAVCQGYSRNVPSRREVTCGIDQGKGLHVVLRARGASGAPEVVGVEEFQGPTDVEDCIKWLKKWNLVAGVIDALPETRVADKFVEAFKGKFFRNFYRDNPTKQRMVWDDTRFVVTSERDNVLDDLYEQYRGAAVSLPRRDKVVEELATHFSKLKKKRERDAVNGNIRYTYVRTGPDHYAHADNYANIALERFEVRHVKGAAYKGLGEANVINPVKLADVDSPVDLLFALVPHERLPWVGVWGAVDQAGVCCVVREAELEGMTLASFVRRLAVEEASDPKEPVERLIPQEFAEIQPGQEMTFLERLEDQNGSPTFLPVETPEMLVVNRIREAMALREDLAAPMPGLLITRNCPGVIEALRMHRPGVKVDQDNDVEVRLSMFHRAVGMILLQEHQVRAPARRRR